ncbi:MAG: DUF11 domain-containing protein, partial [Demequinaceae bacterium]|nr:DUF11 domain-containing protein [Demequinaceae bacterium]
WGQALGYTITVANTSDLEPNPGSAVGVVVTDTVPAGVSYAGCDMGSAAGSCAESGGVVTWTLTDAIAAGASVNLGLATTANWGFSGTVTNTAFADYNDVYGNNYPNVSGSDSADTIEPPTFVITKSSNTGGALVDAGSRLTYTVEIENPTTSGHTNVVVTDTLPAGTTYVPGSTVVTFPGDSVVATATDDFASETYAGGSGWTGPWVEFGDDGLVYGGRVLVSGQRVHFVGPNVGVDRTMNVAGATTATLSFRLSDDNFPVLTTNDLFAWGISVDGGAYQQLGVRKGDVHTAGTTVTADLSSYLPATTIAVSLRGLAGINGSTLWYQVDDVALTVTTPGPDEVRTNAAGGTLTSGEPLTLVTAADGIDLPAGKKMTVTYEVDVTSPVASAVQRYLTNTATVTSDEDAVGRKGSVTDELDRTPILQVAKTGPASALVGDNVTYDFAVSHASASDGSPVSAVNIVDDVAGTPTYVSGDDGDWLLEAGETWIYTADYTILASDPRPLVNTATVDSTDLNGQPVPTATAQHSTDVALPAPSISLTKTTSDTLTAGATVHYSITAQNTGNVPLTGVQISETLTGAVLDGTCDAVTLAPSASTTCNFTYLATQASIDAGSLTNEATVVGTAPSGAVVTDTDAVTLTSTAAAAISLTKTTTATGFASGDVITYTLTAANTGALTLHDVTIAEALVGAAFVGACGPATLAPDAALTCTVEYAVTQADVDAGSLMNDATADGTAPAGDHVTDTASVALAGVDSPSIGVVVTVDSRDYFKAGDVLVFTAVTTNTGPVTL